MSEFHKRLRILKEENKLSAAELAKIIGVSPSTLSFYLKDREPSYDNLIKIASYFSVSVDWLIGYSEFRGLSPQGNRSSETTGITKQVKSYSTMYSRSAELIKDKYPDLGTAVDAWTNDTNLEEDAVNNLVYYALMNAEFLDMVRNLTEIYLQLYIVMGDKKGRVKHDVTEYILSCEKISETIRNMMNDLTLQTAFIYSSLIDPPEEAKNLSETVNFSLKQYRNIHPIETTLETYEELLDVINKFKTYYDKPEKSNEPKE